MTKMGLLLAASLSAAGATVYRQRVFKGKQLLSLIHQGATLS